MIHNRAISIAAFIFIMIWVVKIPQLYPTPFQRQAQIKEMATDLDKTHDFIKEEIGMLGWSKNEIEKRLTNEFTLNWLISLFFITSGCLIGVLLYLRKNFSRFIAIVFSLIFIALKLFSIFGSNYWTQRFTLEFYQNMLKYYPVSFVVDEVTFILQVTLLIFLALPAAKAGFNLNNQLK